ncbi:MAG: metallophosphoesterase [Bacteroidales bacterium]|nr:metallophosphoesterase [Bacteroidales bacterium]
MRLLFIAALSLCALIIDYQIYKHISKRTKRHANSRWINRLYIGYTLTIDLFIFAFIFLVFRWPFYGPHSVSPLPLWLAWLFFLHTIPKCAYFLFHRASKCMGKRLGKWTRRLGLAFALYTAFVLLKGAFYNTTRFEVKYINIESEKIPPAFNGYRVALFSDMHLGNLSRQERFLRAFVEQLNCLRPDMVVHTGDLVNMYAAEITPEVQAILSQLHAPDGVYGVLGNHDMGPYFGKRVAKIGLTPLENTRLVVLRQEEMGWKVLQNESLHIRRGVDSIAIGGLPYPPLPPHFPDSLTNFDLQLATRLLDTTRFNIMLCHTPLVWETMRHTPAFKPIDLLLCGHTHAMQTKIEIGAWKWSPAKWMYPYWSGLYKDDGRYLYVNEGVGYVLYPMRIGGKSEITLITLINKQL